MLLLVALTRRQRALGIGAQPYLLNSNFSIALGGDLRWDEAWYGRAAGFGNTLVVDGSVIDKGGRQFYFATSCPGLE